MRRRRLVGYLNRPDATAGARSDGWPRPGDLATRSRDGYIRTAGRPATDLTRSGERLDAP
jgi:acyl-CoA synthetase (AMP-forming)/AMP-acid ligase II